MCTACATIGKENIKSACVCCGLTNPSESIEQLFDGESKSKMLLKWKPMAIFPETKHPILSIDFENKTTIRSYSITSANDFESRDPSAW